MSYFDLKQHDAKKQQNREADRALASGKTPEQLQRENAALRAYDAPIDWNNVPSVDLLP